MREILYFATHGLNIGFVRIFYFPKRLHFNKITFPPQSPYSSQTGHGVAGMVLRNVAPRQGTETFKKLLCFFVSIVIIEKCSSPIGDGNKISRVHESYNELRNVAPRQGTETIIADNTGKGVSGLLRNVAPRQGTETIAYHAFQRLSKLLRNVAPRQGTETIRKYRYQSQQPIEKCSSPIGDGNM